MRLDFESYSVEVADDAVSVYLGERRYAVLKPGASLDTLESHDVDKPLRAPEISAREDGVDAIWRTKSSLWEEKTYHWRFENELFWLQVCVKGNNAIGDLGFFSDGSRQSHYDFSRFFTPECSLLDQRYYKSMQYAAPDAPLASLTYMLQPPQGGSHWIFTPRPYCYCLGFSEGPWLAAGIAPEPGHYGFSRFGYVSGVNSFCFQLKYDGMTTVDGEWASPKFVFIPGEDEYTALEKYCEALRAWGLVKANTRERAEWWSRPMFCGWGEQHVMHLTRGGAPNQTYATQAVYDRFVEIMREKRINPGTIVIDDKWQKSYGTLEVDTDKWPDLRGWIDARHAEGRHVLLWFGAWQTEGMPENECITDGEGKPVLADPTSPAYQSRIKAILHRMLSSNAGCYNADGIKFDWTGVPGGSGHRLHGEVWGSELFKLLTQQVYEAAKAQKRDALVITHTANPYYAECTDMVRLNDISERCRELVSMMTHRQRIARMACPHALIDCDNSRAPTHAEWMEYMKAQPSLGVPSIYYLTAIDGTLEPITDEDWDALAHIWRA